MASQVTAAFITPECRANRGVDGAWEEAVRRLRDEYQVIVRNWQALSTPERQPTLNLVLTMERPE